MGRGGECVLAGKDNQSKGGRPHTSSSLCPLLLSRNAHAHACSTEDSSVVCGLLSRGLRVAEKSSSIRPVACTSKGQRQQRHLAAAGGSCLTTAAGALRRCDPLLVSNCTVKGETALPPARSPIQPMSERRASLNLSGHCTALHFTALRGECVNRSPDLHSSLSFIRASPRPLVQCVFA